METKFYKVGGCVRDALLGIKSKDVDFAVESDSYETMKQAIIDRGGTIYLEKPQFLTIRAKVPALGDADYVLARKDGKYSDGRRPDEVIPGTLLDDLARRDFTINAIAETESGEIVDPFDGRLDLHSRLIRCVGDTHARMEEDALRILRAIRFHITKGLYFSFELELFLLNPRNIDLLDISVERIREEMKKCFDHDTCKTLRVLEKFSAIRDAVFNSDNKIKLVPTITP